VAGEASESDQKLAGRIYYLLHWEPAPGAGDRSVIHPQHIAYVTSLEADGRLFGAGPILGDDGKPVGRGLFILRVGSAEEAHVIAKNDPYYRAGMRTYRVEPWRRSEGVINLRVNIAANRVDMD
jgi:uncharacterized protein YciI